MINLPILYMIIPCYNEEEVLKDSSRKLREKIVWSVVK